MNKHYEDACTFISEATDGEVWAPEQQATVASMAVAEATLALAYEQRMANLIAVLSEGGPSIHVGDHLINEDYLPLMQQLKERLGLA